LVPDTSTSLKTISAAEARIVEGQFLLEAKILDKENSLIYRAGSRTTTVSKQNRTDFITVIIIIKARKVKLSLCLIS
jgi:hypothetical protein